MVYVTCISFHGAILLERSNARFPVGPSRHGHGKVQATLSQTPELTAPNHASWVGQVGVHHEHACCQIFHGMHLTCADTRFFLLELRAAGVCSIMATMGDRRRHLIRQPTPLQPAQSYCWHACAFCAFCVDAIRNQALQNVLYNTPTT